MVNALPVALFAVALLLFALKRGLTYLHIYQQEEYDSPRFLRWIVANRAFDTRGASALTTALIPLLLSSISGSSNAKAAQHTPILLFYIIAIIALLAITATEQDPRKVGKKKLAMTVRAKRIYWLAMALLALLLVASLLWTPILPVPLIAAILFIQLIPVSLTIANALLDPFEKRIQKRFWNEAHDKLLRLKPTVVGITGSYGKTSVKHILGYVLDASAPTLATPGSVNTPMGISRIVREKLAGHFRFFICEMGAYGPGSIARLCALAPPDLAVITAIGMAHYERFKTIETVVKTKFELAEATVERGGKVVIASDVLKHAYAAEFRQKHPDAVIAVGPESDCQVQILAERETPEGNQADVLWQGRPFTLRTHLFGEHQTRNAVLAFAAAVVAGVSPEDAVTAIASAPQIGHRLEVKRTPGAPTIVDDAYNSNPAGFANGLRLLSLLQQPGGRRVLVTPGMVELGKAHDEEHTKIGNLAAEHVDILLAVLPQRIETLVAAYSSKAPQGKVVRCATFAEASAWMQSNLKPDDVVLMENDLPDLYEKKLSL